MTQAVLISQENKVLWLTLNRAAQRNAFDDHMIESLLQAVQAVQNDPTIRVIALKANGKDFSAGADLTWMKRMAQMNEAENQADAMQLANLLQALYTSKKPTIACIQGAAYGGGAGLVAACDLAIAAESASFCFSEIKLGLIPAIISPYVIEAIGKRMAGALFLTAEHFHAPKALQIGLIHQIISNATWETDLIKQVEALAHSAPEALCEIKKLVQVVHQKPIDMALSTLTAQWIAKKRVSEEGQRGMDAFLHKKIIQWN